MAGEEFARAEAVAGLAREIEGIRRNMDPLLGVSERLDDLARTVAALADVVAAAPPRTGPIPAPSWLVAPPDSAATRRLLDGLCSWLRAVFLRYPDAAAVLPACWLWHPEVVEELTWLMHAWIAAYQSEGASVQLAGDWHDRQRPGVVRRLKESVSACSVERHQTRAGWDAPADTAPPVPGVDAVGSIAAWWAAGRDHPAPQPAPQPAPGAGGSAPGAGGRPGAWGAPTGPPAGSR